MTFVYNPPIAAETDTSSEVFDVVGITSPYVITHTLGRIPSNVFIYDSTGEKIEVEKIDYIKDTEGWDPLANIELTFSVPITGKIILN